MHQLHSSYKSNYHTVTATTAPPVLENAIVALDWEKKGFSTHFWSSGIVDQTTTYCLPLHYICIGCLQGCFPRHQIFQKTFKLSNYFHIVKKYKMYVRYNNT
jgi:hypothetical protein